MDSHTVVLDEDTETDDAGNPLRLVHSYTGHDIVNTY